MKKYQIIDIIDWLIFECELLIIIIGGSSMAVGILSILSKF